jgi:hypothetical protein
MPFLILFAVCWSGLVLLMDWTIGHGYYKQLESRHFPSATGKITHSELQTHTSSKGTSYFAIINYVYKVGGQTFMGDRLAFSEDEPALSPQTIIQSHPLGSAVQIYYNPRNPDESLLYPGVTKEDLTWVLFITPFNVVLFGFWTWIGGWLRLRFFKPVAGGVKIIADGMTTRVRLPRWEAIWWALVTTGGLGFLFTMVVGLSEQTYSLTTFALPITGVAYLAGIGVYVWRCLKINSGDEDLIINEVSGTLELPLTFGRKEHVKVRFDEIGALSIETVKHSGSKGTSYNFAPTLKLRGGMPEQKLAEWSDSLKAVQFAEWLGKKTGISSEGY